MRKIEVKEMIKYLIQFDNGLFVNENKGAPCGYATEYIEQATLFKDPDYGISVANRILKAHPWLAQSVKTIPINCQPII